MPQTVVVMDLETVPDYSAVARLHDLDETDTAACKTALGDKFPKCLWHRIVCVGTLVAQKSCEAWHVVSVDASHMGTQSEAQLVTGLANIVAKLRPQLITFNGSGFDLPVLRYRAMLNRLSLPCFSAKQYFHRYSADAIDLCDVLSSFGASKKASLQEICRSLGFVGKTNGMEGSQVEELVQAGRITDVADYCCSDVVNTYRIWLTYELFCGRLTSDGYARSDVAFLQSERHALV